MTVLSSPVSPCNHYYINDGIDINKLFNIEFPFLETPEYIKVYIISRDGKKSDLKLGLHYDVVLSNGTSNIWGKIKFLQTIETLAGELYIYRNIKNDQDQEFNSQTVLSKALERALDKLTMLYQDTPSQHHFIRAPFSEALNEESLQLPRARERAGGYLCFDKHGAVSVKKLEELPNKDKRENSILGFDDKGEIALFSLLPNRREVYVSIRNGDDNNDGYTPWTPKKNIGAALSIIEQDDIESDVCIFLAPGDYVEDFEINRMVHIQGSGATLHSYITINHKCSIDVYALKPNNSQYIINAKVGTFYINAKMVETTANHKISSIISWSTNHLGPVETRECCNISFNNVNINKCNSFIYIWLENSRELEFIIDIKIGMLLANCDTIIYRAPEVKSNINVVFDCDVGILTQSGILAVRNTAVVMRFNQFFNSNSSSKLDINVNSDARVYINLGVVDKKYEVLNPQAAITLEQRAFLQR